MQSPEQQQTRLRSMSTASAAASTDGVNTPSRSLEPPASLRAPAWRSPPQGDTPSTQATSFRDAASPSSQTSSFTHAPSEAQQRVQVQIARAQQAAADAAERQRVENERVTELARRLNGIQELEDAIRENEERIRDLADDGNI